jgi:hypothetical protein
VTTIYIERESSVLVLMFPILAPFLAQRGRREDEYLSCTKRNGRSVMTSALALSFTNMFFLGKTYFIWSIFYFIAFDNACTCFLKVHVGKMNLFLSMLHCDCELYTSFY